MSSEHNVEGMLEINTGTGKLDIIVLGILSNQLNISSLKDWLDVSS
jgi:hypothetical protein